MEAQWVERHFLGSPSCGRVRFVSQVLLHKEPRKRQQNHSTRVFFWCVVGQRYSDTQDRFEEEFWCKFGVLALIPEAVRIWKEIGNYKGEANSGKALRIRFTVAV